MGKNFTFIILLFCFAVYGQETKTTHTFAIGAGYGYGNEFKNDDYTYTNRYIQLQLYYTFNPDRKWQYTAALQPEVNFGEHRLLNLYFVTPDDPDYIHKREVFTRLKDTREYIFNVALFVKRLLTSKFSIYAMANIGPMYMDTETERMAKGFAFNDVFALGFAYDFGAVMIDVRPNVRHVSNLGFTRPNSGYNTLNMAVNIIVPLK